jgi:hypothetical protein
MNPQERTTRKKRTQKKNESEALVASMTQEERNSLLVQLLNESQQQEDQKNVEEKAKEKKYEIPQEVAKAKISLFGNSQVGSPSKTKQEGSKLSQSGYKYAGSKIAPDDSISNASSRNQKSKIRIKGLQKAKLNRLLEAYKKSESDWIDIEPHNPIHLPNVQGSATHLPNVQDSAVAEKEEDEESEVPVDSVKEPEAYRNRSKCKVEPPKAYDGTRDETLVRTFFYQLENWFELADIDDSRQLKHLANLLKGIALKWFMAIAISSSPFESYQSAKLRIIKEFAPELSNDTARNRLEGLFCGKSYSWFLNRFRDICLEIHDMSSVEKFYAFRRKLPDEFRKEVIEQNATTFEDAVSICNKVELSNQKMRVSTSGKSNTNKDLKNAGTVIKQSNKSDNTKKHKNWENVQQLTLVERDRRLKAKLCLNCASENCQARTCEKPFIQHQ